ncbi:MAG: hypothetical protein JW395_1065 [Nitrospira sp.]|nr:hypothetical protein [Nitrospira sp.]
MSDAKKLVPGFTEEDLQEAANGFQILGPGYFASRRAAEHFMKDAQVEALKLVATKASEMVREKLYEYVEEYFLSDLESNIQSHMVQMLDDTVTALLTGQEWALNRYILARRFQGEEVRAAVCKHGGDALQKMRIEELEKQVAQLQEHLRYSR